MTRAESASRTALRRALRKATDVAHREGLNHVAIAEEATREGLYWLRVEAIVDDVARLMQRTRR